MRVRFSLDVPNSLYGVKAYFGLVLWHINHCWLLNAKSSLYIYSFAKTITDADYTDDIAIRANTPNQAETLLHSLEQAAEGIGLHVNAHKTEYVCYNQAGNISTLDGNSLKLVDKFTYLGSSVSATEKDIDTRLRKAWTAIDRLSIIWISDLTDKMKRTFFQAAVVPILLYGCTTWTLAKRLKKKLNGNYTRMLRAILNKSWRQHPTRHQLYGHLPPITKTIQARRTRHAGHCWRSRDELISDVLRWNPHMAEQKQDDQHEHTDCSYVRIREVALKTCRRRWTRQRSGERGSGISVLAAQHDDNDDIYIEYMIYKHILLIHTVKWSNSSVSNGSVYHKLTKLNGSKYCYVLLTIQLIIGHLSFDS